jgi:hypothetical protein
MTPNFSCNVGMPSPEYLLACTEQVVCVRSVSNWVRLRGRKQGASCESASPSEYVLSVLCHYQQAALV